ncbi:MAG: hypothetical protein ACU0BF_00645 [Paracoccaceae bacterium]
MTTPTQPDLADLFGFSELEEAFLAGEGAKAATEALAWIAETHKTLDDWLASGVPPEEAEDGRTLRDALDAAARIVSSPVPKEG